MSEQESMEEFFEWLENEAPYQKVFSLQEILAGEMMEYVSTMSTVCRLVNGRTACI